VGVSTAGQGAASQQSVIIAQADPEATTWVDTPGGRAAAALLAQQGRSVTTLDCPRETTDIMAYSALNPGLARVFQQICMQCDEGDEFYIRTAPEFAGVGLHTHTMTLFKCSRIDASTDTHFVEGRGRVSDFPGRLHAIRNLVAALKLMFVSAAAKVV
jgi:hypothetical protein